MSRTSRTLRVHPIVLRQVQVVDVRDVTPNLRRLTLGGEELRAGTMGDGLARPPFVSDGFDDHVKLVIPPDNAELPPVGTQEETRFEWNRGVLEFTRDYTVRSYDEAAGTFDIDVVRHASGLAADWAFRVSPGDAIRFAGPKSCAPVNHDVDWHLLIGDDTALPAIGRWLEEAPAGTRATVIVEVPTAQDVQEIATRAEASITWLVRGDYAAGESGQLFEALRATELPEGRGYVWCAGEALTIAPIRRYLRQDLGLLKEDVEVVGYWRRPAAPAAAGEAPQDATAEVLHDVHEMTELLPPVLTRVAATLGIGTHIAAGVTSVEGLAAATGITPARLLPVVQSMQALGLLTDTDGVLANTAHGRVLTETEYVEELSLDNPANRQVLALVDLLDVLRTGTPSSAAPETPEAADAVRDREADQLYYVLEPLGRMPEVAAADLLTVAGRTGDLAASQILAAAPRPGRSVQVASGPGAGAWERHDGAVLLCVLEGRTDEDAVALLRAALDAGPSVAVVERVADQVPHDDHAAEDALTTLALTGVPARTSADLEALLREAGAATVQTRELGWGFGAYNRVTVAHA